MLTTSGHLTYCTNIHPGEQWSDHFAALRETIPAIKKKIAPAQPFGIGLRLSNIASLALSKQEALHDFQQWLAAENCYVFTMNGFPYGGFHRTIVKDQVHAPDWTTDERLQYTIRLFRILAALLPEEMDGGVSTSPLSYKHWHATALTRANAVARATWHILLVAEQLVHIKRSTGKLLHLDIEPEPDGLLETGQQFLDWYLQELLPVGMLYLQDRFGFDTNAAIAAIKEHIRLCYDVCHFAVGYEDHAHIIQQLQQYGIRTGKIQISAALKARLPDNRYPVANAFSRFNETTYLHQVIALQQDGSLHRYADLPLALEDVNNDAAREWRAHFHVPLFVKEYGELQSTQEDIVQVLSIQQQQPFTQHLEIETYTWEVLPDALKLPIGESIVREMEWVVSLQQSLSGTPAGVSPAG